MLRHLAPELVARVKAYASARGLSLPAGAVQLLEQGLHVTEARRSGALAVNAARTPDERSEAARKAAHARYGR